MTTIALDIAAFRLAFDSFASETTYPDAAITKFWAMATCYVSDTDTGRLRGACRVLAIQAMTAHLIDINDKLTTGAATGQVVAASEDGVSVSLTPPTNRNQWQWWLSITPYGAQLSALLSKASVGGMYIGGSPERRGFRKYGSRF
mgnify:CR=1 FL=1|tara:strand:- start:85 stop:519 length:435 start_codon:yes stop_codon:yes gene_type:complete